MHPMLNIAVQAARKAGKVVTYFVDRPDKMEAEKKGANDFVTLADKLAEEEIIRVIQHSYPHHTILSEESGLTQGENEDFCWIIDPLDGTTNFVHGFPQIAISIALKHRGQLEIGVIYDPLRQELYTASRGEGAQLNNQRLRVSQTKKLSDGLIGTSFPNHDKNKIEPYLASFNTLLPLVSSVRRAGSAALDLAYVAAGRLDGCWASGLQSWDIAAGILLIREAGGMSSDFNGQDQSMENGTIIAGNPKIHPEMLKTLQPLFAK